jgi:hypothetical protein
MLALQLEQAEVRATGYYWEFQLKRYGLEKHRPQNEVDRAKEQLDEVNLRADVLREQGIARRKYMAGERVTLWFMFAFAMLMGLYAMYFFGKWVTRTQLPQDAIARHKALGASLKRKPPKAVKSDA